MFQKVAIPPAAIGKDPLLSPEQAAHILGVSYRTLEAWRSRGIGPKFHKVGRCVRYASPDLQSFVGPTFQNTREARQ